MKEQIELMKQWCIEHYEQGADTMVECWSDEDYSILFGDSRTPEQAWKSLKALASIYAERQADADNSAF
jgi:hypothetical protein